MKHTKRFIWGFLGIVLMASSAMAEMTADSRAMYDRMDRLERDITLLQRRIYKGGNEVVAAGADTGATQSASMPEGSVQHLYAKMAELEQLVAGMTSQMEELSHQVAQTQEQMKRMNADMDFRLAESKAVPTGVVPVPAAITSSVAVPKDAKGAYDAAYSLLKQLKYAEAESALQNFLATYPEHELAGNAQYWLGETYYVRGQYQDAAVAFATGFKKYKSNTKGPDNLLKLGLSMQQLGKKKEACTAFKSLKKEFPKASQVLISRAAKESDKLGCGK